MAIGALPENPAMIKGKDIDPLTTKVGLTKESEGNKSPRVWSKGAPKTECHRKYVGNMKDL
jgi:hypothetical protein